MKFSSELLGLSAKLMADLLTSNFFTFPSRSEEKKKTIEQNKLELIAELSKHGIDPKLFDALLTSEIDRKLKIQFGKLFIALTFIFTSASFLIVILDSVFSWGISDMAITALIIEIPIQFVGIMYIIARNLFPNSNNDVA